MKNAMPATTPQNHISQVHQALAAEEPHLQDALTDMRS